MNVVFVSVAGRSHQTFNPAIEAVEAILGGDYHRISFGGTTALGRSGISLDMVKGRVSGHKIEEIPEELEDQVAHYDINDRLLGIRAFARGHDVLIGSKEHGILLKWHGPGFAVYGAGDDSVH